MLLGYFCLFVVFRFFYLVVFKPKKRWSIVQEKNKKVLVVLGSEPLYNDSMVNEFIYILSATDSLSRFKIPQGHASRFIQIPRSRHVGQSWFTSLFTTLKSLFFCIPILFKEMPDALICNGPGTCIPPALISFCISLMGIKHIKIFFIESLARVHHLSLSGRILYWIADRFLVQWPYIQSKRAEYLGRLV